MTKKNKKSFADRAKEIQNKYTRAKFDPIEAADMEAELEALIAEQEAVRESMGLNNEEQVANGGKMYANGSFMVPTELQNQGINFLSNLNTPMIPMFNSPTQTIIDSSQPLPNTELETTKLQSLVGDRSSAVNNISQNPNFLQRNKEYLPSAISGLSNIGSNLLLAAMAKKGRPKYTPTLGTPERINLEPKAEQLRKSATTAKNVALRNARNLGVNAGQTLANMGAIGADIDRNLGDTLTNLYLGQEQANVGTANQFNLANMEALNRAGLLNTQIGLQDRDNQLGYISGALSTIPGVMKDINLKKADEATRRMYQNYINTIGRNYYLSGDLFGNLPIQYGVR